MLGLGAGGVYQQALPAKPAPRNLAEVASNASAISVPDAPLAPSVLARIGAFVALTKPRIIELLLITTVPTMVVAGGAWPPFGLLVATLAGGALSAGGANAANMYLDRDIDALMKRTSRRPLVTGMVSPPVALVFAASLEAAAFLVLWFAVNPLSAVLALSAAIFYVFVYTAGPEALIASEHRYRRSGWCCACPGGLGGGPGLVGLGSPGAVRVGVLVDATSLLGTCDPLPGRLRECQRTDDAGGGELRANRVADLRLLR